MSTAVRAEPTGAFDKTLISAQKKHEGKPDSLHTHTNPAGARAE